MLGRILLMWINRKVKLQNYVSFFFILEIDARPVLVDRRTPHPFHLRPPRDPVRTPPQVSFPASHAPSSQARSNRMGRSLARRERDRCLLHRAPDGAHVPDPDEPFHEHPPALASHGLPWLHRQHRPGGLRRAPVPHRAARVEVRDC